MAATSRKFIATDAQRQQVTVYVAVGISQEQIALLLGISIDTVQRHFRTELDNGAPLANAKVAGKLFNEAMQGNVTCMIFWLKTRAGWREVNRVETTFPDGVPATIELTPEERAAWAAARDAAV
jgi:transposase